MGNKLVEINSLNLASFIPFEDKIRMASEDIKLFNLWIIESNLIRFKIATQKRQKVHRSEGEKSLILQTFRTHFGLPSAQEIRTTLGSPNFTTAEYLKFKTLKYAAGNWTHL